jgi:hypothetical protein
VDAAADGAYRHLKHIADLGIRQSSDITQDERGSELVGERVQRRLDVGTERPAGKLVVGSGGCWQDLVRLIGQRLDRTAAPAT